jgi:hypothetical protein
MVLKEKGLNAIPEPFHSREELIFGDGPWLLRAPELPQ